uniref:Uncharacterized protein n=1 Tax=Neospora caninum (strain Liverpool) TaxID=572307 RepID=A0A0F7URW2_NEOCL|nr:TPA: hypothetical protein BN1204_065125 [Neospora caninum Liverpool]
MSHLEKMLRGERVSFHKITAGFCVPSFSLRTFPRTCSSHPECLTTRSAGGFLCGRSNHGSAVAGVAPWEGGNRIRTRSTEMCLSCLCSRQWGLQSPWTERRRRLVETAVHFPKIAAPYGAPYLQRVENRRIGMGIFAGYFSPVYYPLPCGAARATLHSFSGNENPRDGGAAQSVKVEPELTEKKSSEAGQICEQGNRRTGETPKPVRDTLTREDALRQKNDQPQRTAEELAEKARVAETLWQTCVPERSWGLTSPVFWVLLVAVVVLHEINDKRDRERANSRTVADETEAELREQVAKTRAKRREGEIGD